MAEVIFSELAEQNGVRSSFIVGSRGIEPYHVGNGADPRAVTALAKQELDGSKHIAQQVSQQDIADTDLFIALDRGHQRVLQSLGAKRVRLLADYDEQDSNPDVFDPYYSEGEVFESVRDRIERCCQALLSELMREHSLDSV